jgi:Protein of unknown function (DUF4058)
MPIHDWARVEACIFHSFHLSWTVAISSLFNNGGLPPGYYSLTEQHKHAFEFELPLIGQGTGVDEVMADRSQSVRPIRDELRAEPPETYLVLESDMEHYRRRHRTVIIRHESDHEVVALVEIVSPADKYSPRAVRLLVEKTAQFLERDVHVLVVDLYPPGKFDPRGIHGEIWEDVVGQHYVAVPDRPLTLVSYESQGAIRAYVEPAAVGDCLPEMPLFLRSGQYVTVPLETTYETAWTSVPATWRNVIEVKT